MAESKWRGRTILDPAHAEGLETAAALNEFRDRKPQKQAEDEAHNEYQREHHLNGAAHHLRGMKISQASGDHEEALKHSSLYGLHLQALGENPYTEPPSEVRARMKAPADKKLYRYKAHAADSLLGLSKAEPINARYALRKAWPKDDQENQENAKGFLNQPAAQDAILQTSTDPTAQFKTSHARAPSLKGVHESVPADGFGADPEGWNRCRNCGTSYEMEAPPHTLCPECNGVLYDDPPIPGEGYADPPPLAVETATTQEPAEPWNKKWTGSPDDKLAAKTFWTRIGRAAGIQKSMAKAWPKDEKDNQAQRSGFPGGAAHQVMEDQHMELGGQREEFAPPHTLWEGLERPDATRSSQGIQPGGKKLSQVGPYNRVEPSDEAEMNRHALIDASLASDQYEPRVYYDLSLDQKGQGWRQPTPMGNGLPFGVNLPEAENPYGVIYSGQKGQAAKDERSESALGNIPPAVGRRMQGARNRAAEIIAEPPASQAEGVPAPDTNAWAALKARLAPKLKKGDDGTGVVAAPKMPDTMISPTKISAPGARPLIAPGPAVGGMPKITPTKPQPGGLVPPPGGSPMVPSTPHPLDLGPGMAGHPRQISAPAIPPVVPTGRLGLSYSPAKKSEPSWRNLVPVKNPQSPALSRKARK